MEIDAYFMALAVPAVLFAGISKGGFGSGAAFAATPLMALVLPPAQAAAMMLPLLMLMDVAALRPFWGGWDRTAARLLILGSLPGIGLGAVFFGLADPDVFRLLIGIIAVGFVAYTVASRRGLIRGRGRPMAAWTGLVSGAVAGFTSTISHAGGPPAAIYMLSRGMTKTEYQATSVIVFWAINLLKAGPYWALGLFDGGVLWAGLILAPFALIGVWAGVVLHRLVPQAAYFALTYALLMITGTKLIWDALT